MKKWSAITVQNKIVNKGESQMQYAVCMRTYVLENST
jgi:hypothetical protein